MNPPITPGEIRLPTGMCGGEVSGHWRRRSKRFLAARRR